MLNDRLIFERTVIFFVCLVSHRVFDLRDQNLSWCTSVKKLWMDSMETEKGKEDERTGREVGKMRSKSRQKVRM